MEQRTVFVKPAKRGPARFAHPRSPNTSEELTKPILKAPLADKHWGPYTEGQAWISGKPKTRYRVSNNPPGYNLLAYR